MEERKNKRLPVEVGCWLVEMDEASCVYTLNVSDTGVSVITDLLLPVGRTVHLQFFTPASAEAVTVEAEVVWNRLEPEGSMGLRFLSVDEQKRNVIREFIRLEQQRKNP
ncbi:MAG: PilZ domain [Geobacteraceae bacterium]|nr:MAG: PilZ domain [Geobacteraceae bacterium]